MHIVTRSTWAQAGRKFACFALAVLACLPLTASAEQQISDQALLNELKVLWGGAGTVFVGQIIAADRKPGCVEVVFRVELPVRGSVGERFVLREWTGLWAPGAARYVVGQRVLAFLRTAGRGALTSPVFGPEGLVPVAVQGADRPELLDVRWIAAAVPRDRSTPLLRDADAAFQLADVLEFLAGRRSPSEVQRVALPGASVRPQAYLPGAIASPLPARPVSTSPDGVSSPRGASHAAR